MIVLNIEFRVVGTSTLPLSSYKDLVGVALALRDISKKISTFEPLLHSMRPSFIINGTNFLHVNFTNGFFSS